MEIRKTMVNDIEQIVSLEEKYLGETLGYSLLHQELNNPLAKFFTVLVNNNVAGYISAWVIDDTIDVINLVVDEKYQRKGFGTALIHTLIALGLEKNDALEIILDVRCTNQKALNFYHKLGFEKIGERKAYYKNGDDAYTMLLKVAKGAQNENISN